MIELLLQAERALEMGRVDAAEALYRQVADSDPRNAIAVVGLARVALERGDELDAYLTARRARSIDPENAAAGRMVQRLEEVMRYRGDAVPAVPGDAPAAAVPAGSAAGPVPVGQPPSVLAEVATATAAPKRRRSLLDRLLRRNR